MYDLVIRNGLCFVQNRFIECNIGVNKNKIVYIGKDDVSGDIEIDANSSLVLPGLFNAHTHAAMTMLRGYAESLPLRDWLEKVWRIEAELSERDVFWGTMLACLEMVKSGVTCFSDMYIHMDSVAEAVGEFGMRAVLGYGMADRGSEERAEKELDIALKFISSWDGSFEGRITCTLTPHAPYTCSPDFLRKVAEVSKERNIVKHIHIAETLWEVKEVKREHGKRPLELLNDVGFLDNRTVIAHAVWLSNDEIKLLAKKRASVAHCPVSNMKLSSGIARVAEMLDAGVNVCLGTDGAASNNTLNMFVEMRVAALLQLLRKRPLQALQILKMATENGYKAYFINGGALEVGKLADVVILKKNFSYYPLYNIQNSIVFASYGCEVDTVIVDGELVVEDGIVLTIDEDRVISNVERRASRFALENR